jgi:hypothetical protein
MSYVSGPRNEAEIKRAARVIIMDDQPGDWGKYCGWDRARGSGLSFARNGLINGARDGDPQASTTTVQDAAETKADQWSQYLGSVIHPPPMVNTDFSS